MKKRHVSGAIPPCLWCNTAMSLVFSEVKNASRLLRLSSLTRKAAMAPPPPFLLTEPKTAKK